MIMDKQGNSLTGATTETAELFDQAVDVFNIYRGDPITPLDKAIEAAPDFKMAQVMKAHLLTQATEPGMSLAARKIIDNLKSGKLSDREASHVLAIEHILNGNWTAAGVALDKHNINYPHDLLALQCGHLIDFFRANARNLRDRISRVLPKWSAELPGYSILLGMHAFGLEETGDYARAEEVGRHAVELQPLDCWAHHAVTHVMEMQNRAEDGIGWMIAREPYWSGDDNFFKVHNWWHLCLFHLDLGHTERVLELYDTRVREDKSSLALNLIDASSLLWRLQLCDIDVGDRWQEIATAWEKHAIGSDYPFNDWHIAMAWLGAGRDDDMKSIYSNLQNLRTGENDVAEWIPHNAQPLIEGFTAFWQGNYSSAAEKLYGARYIANTFGGSHAQRDIIDLTLIEAAIRGGHNNLAEALLNERLALKPRGNINHKLLSRSKSGDAAKARIAA